MDLLINYLQNGTSIILCDLDALFRADPFPALSQLQTKSQFIASRGLWPRNLSDRWGATLCMGFIYFKASKRQEAKCQIRHPIFNKPLT